MTKFVAEICCDSVRDAVTAEKAGAQRIELNNSMALDGLTPSIGTVRQVVENTTIAVAAMVRPRPGGFCYNSYESQTMLSDIDALAQCNIEGLVFGCLTENNEIDLLKTKEIVALIHSYGKAAVFHRAFDNVADPHAAIQILIELGVDRVLTSGLKSTALEGAERLATLQEIYGNSIEIIGGSGITADNVATLKEKTGLTQFHSSCKSWSVDPTTMGAVSFSFANHPHETHYHHVNEDIARNFVKSVMTE